MKTNLKVVLTAAAVLAATSGPVLAADSSVRDAVRHPIRTMKEKMNTNRADTSRADQAGRSGRSGRSGEMPSYGSSGAMSGASGGGMSGNEQYAADRERTRERARAYVESGGRSGSTSTMRQGTSGR